jgi:hypothetical protein
MMKISRALAALGLVCAVGGANASLVGRDINGNAVIQRDGNGVLDSSAVFLYDDVLDVTWLRDANANGPRQLTQHKIWIQYLTVGSYGGWRLPTMIDTGAAGCNFAYVYTDCGWNVKTKSGNLTQYQAGQTVYNEMASLFYDTLGNKAVVNTGGGSQAGGGLTKTGDFQNLQANDYLSGSVYGPGGNTSYFSFDDGFQSQGISGGYALAVRPGDVLAPSAVPIPAAAWLMLSGIGVLGAAARRRQSTLVKS